MEIIKQPKCPDTILAHKASIRYIPKYKYRFINQHPIAEEKFKKFKNYKKPEQKKLNKAENKTSLAAIRNFKVIGISDNNGNGSKELRNRVKFKEITEITENPIKVRFVAENLFVKVTGKGSVNTVDALDEYEYERILRLDWSSKQTKQTNYKNHNPNHSARPALHNPTKEHLLHIDYNDTRSSRIEEKHDFQFQNKIKAQEPEPAITARIRNTNQNKNNNIHINRVIKNDPRNLLLSESRDNKIGKVKSFVVFEQFMLFVIYAAVHLPCLEVQFILKIVVQL